MSRLLPAAPGSRIAIRLTGPRRCVGWWLADARRRRPCPTSQPVPAAETAAQCPSCAAADPGRAFARDTVVDDGRRYALYLAWFGIGLPKVGLTAIDRGVDRLAEQGALTFSWLASGPLPAVRQAERRVAATGLAPQRRNRSTKISSWWRLPDLDARRSELEAVHQQATAVVDWPAGLNLRPFDAVDNVDRFGLHSLPSTYHEAVAVADGAVLTATVTSVVGRELLLDCDNTPILIDTRLLAGWPVQPAAGPTAGLTMQTRTRPRTTDADNDTLF